jgi:hypothetical protein
MMMMVMSRHDLASKGKSRVLALEALTGDKLHQKHLNKVQLAHVPATSGFLLC